MRVRYAGILVVLLTIVFGTITPATSAYNFHGYRWPGGLVRYFNDAPDQAWAVHQAVAAWNNSGAHVRFVAVPRSQAQLLITDPADKVYCSEGHASVGYVRDAHVVIFPARGITHGCNQYWAAEVMAHELGHVLGLQHEDRYCAAMNSSGSLRGGHACSPKLLWAWRCRLLETDDVAGVAAIYGGKPKAPRAQPLCPLYGEMQAPSHPSASYDPATASVTINFVRPAEPSIPAFAVPSPWKPHDSYVILGPSVKCPTLDVLSNDVFEVTHWAWHARAGQEETFTASAKPGAGCYGIWAVDKLGRPSGASFVHISVS